MFPGVKDRICSADEMVWSENKGEVQVELEMNHSVPGRLAAEISRLNNEIKCLKDEIRMMMVEKGDQIKEQKQGKKNENSNQEAVIAQITTLKDELMKLKDEIKKIQDARQLERLVAEKKQQKETEKQWHEINMRFDSKEEELLKEKNCTVENKEADMVLKPAKVKDLNGTGQMIQEITQSIKQEKHKQSIVPQDEQKCVMTLNYKEELKQYKMIMREILSIWDVKLLRMMYCDNQLKIELNIQEVYQRFKLLHSIG